MKLALGEDQGGVVGWLQAHPWIGVAVLGASAVAAGIIEVAPHRKWFRFGKRRK